MYENKLIIILMCVCVSFQVFFTLTKAHKESTGRRPGRKHGSRLNTRLRTITKILQSHEKRHFLPKSHRQELAATIQTSATETQRSNLPKYMLDLYESAKAIEESISEMDIPWNGFQKGNIRQLIKGILPKWQYDVKFVHLYSFNRSNLPEKIYDSELVLTLPHHRRRHCHFTDLRLYTTPSHLSLPRMHFKENNLVINMTDIIKNATKLKTENFTLGIVGTRLRRQPCLSNTNVLLVMYTGISIESIQKAAIHRKHQLSRTSVSRHRRSADNSSLLHDVLLQSENHTLNNITVCRKKTWEVFFQDIQWTFIQYPTNYSIDYCAGTCVGLMDSRISNHAFLRNHYHIVTQYQNRNIPFSCCVPSKTKSLVFLYTDQNDTVELSDMPNLIAETCSCL